MRLAPIPKHVCALGLLNYYAIRDSIATPPIIDCPQCNKQAQQHYYGVGWCDACACAAGYLPKGYDDIEARTVFKAMLDCAVRQDFTWYEKRNLVNYWMAQKEKMFKGDFTADWYKTVQLKQIDPVPCAFPGCDNLLGAYSKAGFCGNTCYHRDYRNKKKIDIAKRRKERNEEKKLAKELEDRG